MYSLAVLITDLSFLLNIMPKYLNSSKMQTAGLLGAPQGNGHFITPCMTSKCSIRRNVQVDIRKHTPARMKQRTAAALLACLCLWLCTGNCLAASRQRRNTLKPVNISLPTPKICACQNATTPLSLDSTKMAVLMAQKRSPKLYFKIAWDELGDEDTSSQQSSSATFGPTLHSCTAREQLQLNSLPHQEELINCLNAHHNPRGITWARAIQDDMATLKVVGSWSTSNKPLSPPASQSYEKDQGSWTGYPDFFHENTTTTLVTTSTSDRLTQLEAQCRTWPGPLSVALFLGLIQEDATGPLTPKNQALLRQAVVKISMFAADMATTPDVCQLDVMLTYEVYAEEEAKILFPVNMLRNYARLQARTPLVALVDVDLVVSKSIGNRIHNPEVSKHLLQEAQDKTVFIIPAFDVVGAFEVPAWADALVASSKETMVHAYDRDWVMPFHSHRFPVGHRLTNFTRWRVAIEDYQVPYESRCEPWVIGDRMLMPMHDARFRAFGLNKIQHIATLDAEQFKFKVLHDVFLVHRPHKFSGGQKIWCDGCHPMPGLPSLRAHNYALFQDQQTLMSTRNFQPVISPAVQHCMTVLPWWAQPLQQQAAAQRQTDPEQQADEQAQAGLQPVNEEVEQQQADDTQTDAQQQQEQQQQQPPDSR